MQSNSPFSTPPPIPTPDGNFTPVQPQATIMDRSDWKTAPSIVRGWAYPLTWLGIVVLPFAMLGTMALISRAGIIAVLLLAFFVALFAADIWLNQNFKKGAPAAWVLQIVLSSLSVLSLPISLLTRGGNPIGSIVGFLIHGYILSQWFKPETKAWFGRS